MSELDGWTETSAGPAEPADVREMAESLMRQHGLTGWTLVFDNAKQRAGQCRRNKREISLSAPLMSLWTEAQQRDTVLHEIAHALTKGGHGLSWQLMCLAIGANPARTWGDDGEQEIEGKYLGTCPNGHTIVRHRRKNVSCTQCDRYYNPRYLFVWTVRETEN